MKRTWWRRLDRTLAGMGLLVAVLVTLSLSLTLLALWSAQAEGMGPMAWMTLASAGVAGVLAPVLAYIGWNEAQAERDRSQVKLRPSRSFGGPAMLPPTRCRGRGWRNRRRGLPEDLGRT